MYQGNSIASTELPPWMFLAKLKCLQRRRRIVPAQISSEQRPSLRGSISILIIQGVDTQYGK